MNKLEKLCAAIVLTLALSLTASAGIMDTPAVTSPPPSGQTSVTGNMETPPITSSETSDSLTVATDSVTEIALYLFDSMMYSIF